MVLSAHILTCIGMFLFPSLDVPSPLPSTVNPFLSKHIDKNTFLEFLEKRLPNQELCNFLREHLSPKDAMHYMINLELSSVIDRLNTEQFLAFIGRQINPYELSVFLAAQPNSKSSPIYTHLPILLPANNKPFFKDRTLTSAEQARKDKYGDTCLICKKWFTPQYKLKAHMRSHLNKKPYTPKACNKPS